MPVGPPTAGGGRGPPARRHRPRLPPLAPALRPRRGAPPLPPRPAAKAAHRRGGGGAHRGSGSSAGRGPGKASARVWVPACCVRSVPLTHCADRGNASARMAPGGKIAEMARQSFKHNTPTRQGHVCNLASLLCCHYYRTAIDVCLYACMHSHMSGCTDVCMLLATSFGSCMYDRC